MPLLDRDDQEDRDERNVEILGEVRLVSFKADPDHIGPFGASHLSWRVEGPSGFHVRLDFLTVQKTGDKIVQPASTTTYRLSAYAGQANRTLGHVTVTVDSTGCESYEPILKPRVTYQGALTAGVQQTPDVYFRSQPPGVTLSPGRIAFSLRLGIEVPWFVNPDVNIDASFGLSVVDGTLVATGEMVSVDVTVPWWAWATPGAMPALAIALDMGRDKARKSAHEAIAGLVELTNYFTFAVAPAGKRLRTVRVDAGNGADGIIEVTFCPYDLLTQFAALSGVVLVK